VSGLDSPRNFSRDLQTPARILKVTRRTKLDPIGQSEKLENKFVESKRSAFKTVKPKRRLSPIQEATQKTDKDSNTSFTPPPLPSQWLPLPPPAPKKERPARLEPLAQGRKTNFDKNKRLLFPLGY
tara:strand:- start:2224 stop:2601 length:378 start_codon:yes stop_codon:yes gene_type:complete